MLSSLDFAPDRETSVGTGAVTYDEKPPHPADGRDRSQGRAQGNANSAEGFGGHVPETGQVSASGRAIGFIEDEIDAYIDERIAERERGYIPSASELARIEASREGRRKAREARAAEQAAIARKPRGRKHVETAA